MLELALCIALATAVIRARRARHSLGLGAGILAAYLLAADDLSVFAARSQPQPPIAVFSYAFLGLGCGLLRAPGVLPLPLVLLNYPLVTRTLRIALCGLVSWRCLRESSELNPLLPRAYTLDGIGIPFAGAAVADALVLLLLAFADLIAHGR